MDQRSVFVFPNPRKRYCILLTESNRHLARPCIATAYRNLTCSVRATKEPHSRHYCQQMGARILNSIWNTAHWLMLVCYCTWYTTIFKGEHFLLTETCSQSVPVWFTPYSACSVCFFSRNSFFLSQQFNQNNVFQPVSAKIQQAEHDHLSKCFVLEMIGWLDLFCKSITGDRHIKMMHTS